MRTGAQPRGILNASHTSDDRLRFCLMHDLGGDLKLAHLGAAPRSRRIGGPQPGRGGISSFAGPPGRSGRSAKRPSVSMRSYITIAPAIPTLMEKRVGIFTTWRQRASTGSESDKRSAPNT